MRVRLKRDLIQDATGDHPDLIVAEKDMLGTVMTDDELTWLKHRWWQVYVQLDNGDVVGCGEDDLEVVQP